MPATRRESPADSMETAEKSIPRKPPQVCVPGDNKISPCSVRRPDRAESPRGRLCRRGVCASRAAGGATSAAGSPDGVRLHKKLRHPVARARQGRPWRLGKTVFGQGAGESTRACPTRGGHGNGLTAHHHGHVHGGQAAWRRCRKTGVHFRRGLHSPAPAARALRAGKTSAAGSPWLHKKLRH